MAHPSTNGDPKKQPTMTQPPSAQPEEQQSADGRAFCLTGLGVLMAVKLLDDLYRMVSGWQPFRWVRAGGAGWQCRACGAEHQASEESEGSMNSDAHQLQAALRQSEGFCELQMWAEAGDVLEDLPDHLRNMAEALQAALPFSSAQVSGRRL